MDFNTLSLNYYAGFGCGDGSDAYDWDVELDDTQAAAYEKAVMTRTPLEDVPELENIVGCEYGKIIEQETATLIEEGDEYALECIGELELDPDDLNEKVHNGDAHAIAYFGLHTLSEEERQAWDAYDLPELPLIKDYVDNFVPVNPYEEGYDLSVALPEVTEIELEEEEVYAYLRKLFAAGDVKLAEQVVSAQGDYFYDCGENAYKIAKELGCTEYVDAHRDDFEDDDDLSVTFEVKISVDRPWYCTECDYSATVSREDFEAIANSHSWEELPQEVYDRIYDSVIEEIEADLRDDGTLDDDENADDRFSFYIVHPNEDEECDDWDEDDDESDT